MLESHNSILHNIPITSAYWNFVGDLFTLSMLFILFIKGIFVIFSFVIKDFRC